MTRQSPDDVVLQQILRFRRRLAYRAFVRALCVTVPAVSVLASGYRLWFPPASLTWPWLLVAGAAGIGAAALIAAWGTPSIDSAGRIVDRRLGLSDRVGAALALRGQEDAMARLVVADAAAHVGAHRPDRTFPLEIHRRAAAAGLVMAAVAVVTVRNDARTGEHRAAAEGRVVSASTAGNAASASDGARPAVAKESDVARTTPSNSIPAERLPSGAPPADATNTSRVPKPSPNDSGDNATQGTEGRPADAVPPQTPDGNGSDRASSSAHVTVPDVRKRTTEANGSQARKDGQSGRQADGTSATATSGSATASATSDDSAARTRTAAGGVSRGVLRTSRTDMQQPPAATGTTTTNGRIRASNGPAYPYEEIPPDLREYVRRYLSAIADGTPR